MVKVLAPTDFSGSSKAGLRFAIQWSTQQKLQLAFFHMFHAVKLPQWTDEDFKKYIDNKSTRYTKKLNRFVNGIYKSMGIKPGKYSCVVKHGISADIAIMDYCREKGDFNFISIATRGAGKLKKLFGTNTGNLITKSPVPVIAVPKKYRKKSLKHLLYATDFYDYSKELNTVEDFARPLKAKIEVLHLTWPGEVLPNKDTINKRLMEISGNGAGLKIKRSDITHSLFRDLKNQMFKSKPSLIVMFTDQHRSFFERTLFPSKTEQLSFGTSIPLLAFQKK